MRRISRRVLLASLSLPLLAAAPTAVSHGGSLILRPRGPKTAYRLAAQPIASRLTFAGFRGAFSLPGEAIILGAYPIADRELLAVGFDASALAGVTQKLVALIGWDGHALRILDIETLEFDTSDNGSKSILKATLAATRDHQALTLTVDASRAEHGKSAHHESWTDRLVWRDSAPLAVETAKKPPGDSWQARMIASRRRIDALLTPARTNLTLDMLAPTGLLDPLGAAAK